jgi:hypothetical protein
MQQSTLTMAGHAPHLHAARPCLPAAPLPLHYESPSCPRRSPSTPAQSLSPPSLCASARTRTPPWPPSRAPCRCCVAASACARPFRKPPAASLCPAPSSAYAPLLSLPLANRLRWQAVVLGRRCPCRLLLMAVTTGQGLACPRLAVTKLQRGLSLPPALPLPAEVGQRPTSPSRAAVCMKKKKDPRVRGKQVQGVFCRTSDSCE